MTDLASLAARIIDGSIEVIDLTSPLHARTPILQLPPEWGQTQTFQLEEISRYDDRGPAWYWNNFRTGEHTGTHLDAPNHWVTGKDLDDVSQIPPRRLIGPAVVIDRVKEATANPDYLLDVADLEDFQRRAGQLPENGWLLFRTGWSARGDDPEAFANADGAARTPRASRPPPPATWPPPTCSASEWRPSAPTPARPSASTRRSPATRRCSGRASTGSPSSATSTGCPRPARS